MTIILDNAVKFSNKGGEINISLAQNKNFAVLEISDKGIGIDEKGLPYIFDRFYKVDASRSKIDYEGFGLGLSIAHEIVAIHKGTISVKSKLDSGSIFTIKLPISN